MLQAVPFARTLNISFISISSEAASGVHAVAELPDDVSVHNHIGGPHAGAMYSLAELASGAVVMGTFADQLNHAVPLAVRAEIAYRKLAMGTVRASATLARPPAEVVAELGAGTRPEFPVRVEMTRPDGVVCAEVTVVWTLRPH